MSESGRTMPATMAAEHPSRPGVARSGERAIVEAVGVSRRYASGDVIVQALDQVDLRVASRELLCVRGRSGSGKTTLLNILGGLDQPTSGHVSLIGRDLSAMSEAQLVQVRRQIVSFIFQGFGLLPILSAAENVEVPLRLLRVDPTERDQRVAEVLDLVGLGQRSHHRPHELSGGEQQRVAVARALAVRPTLLLADEPTGQLDSETGHKIMSLLRSVARTESITMVVATHDPLMLGVADRVVELRDGRIAAADTTASEPRTRRPADIMPPSGGPRDHRIG
ncbi:MAG: ABC transporter ATP-binding protein [Candidatus Limnocylindrales bacterium]